MINGDFLPTLGKEFSDLGYEVAIIAGGSYSYKQDAFESFDEIRDIDLLLVVKGKEKFLDLVKNRQGDIDRILKITKPEIHFSEADLSPLFQGYADAIRYSGINEYEQKISIKMIEQGYAERIFSENEPGRINVLSKKDKRFYAKKTIDGSNFYLGVINQKTPSGLTILGDPDLFELNGIYSLGVIADVLLSGKAVHDEKDIIGNLKKLLIKKVARKYKGHNGNMPDDWTKMMVRRERFPAEFIKEFNDYANSAFGDIEGSDEKSKRPDKKEYYVQIASPIIPKTHSPLRIAKKMDEEISELRYITTSGPFSSNSKYGVAVLSNGENVFFKEMLNEFRFRGEIYGFTTASAYYGRLQEPIFTDPGKNMIAYKWFDGDITARKRLDLVTDDLMKNYMETELRKAEDSLNAYLLSATDIHKGVVKKEELYTSRIHDLFYGRLMGDRLSKFYNDFTFETNGIKVGFEELMGMTIVINGVTYRSIRDSVDKARSDLFPEYLNEKLMICGLGDAHSGNIMSSGNPDDYLYIDYEFSGFHSPYLDMAKAIYNDCSFNIFYVDKLPKQDFHIEVKVDGDRLIIEHDYKFDSLSKFLLKTKMEGVVLPMRDFLNGKGISTDDDWLDTLGSAMLCCGLLTRNLSEFDETGFFLNLANVIEATKFETYYNNHI